jgi:Carboxypeptidase regulatory-like domain
MNKAMKSTGLKRASLILSALIFVSSAIVHAATGDLDLSFSDDGRITGDFISGTPGSSYAATAIQGDCKIVVAGGYSQLPLGFTIVRYLGDSPVSTSFTVSGRVATPSGAGLRNAVVSIIDAKGFRRNTTTSSFGLYHFDNIPSGASDTLAAASRRYRFTPRTLTVNGDLTSVDLVGLE